MHDFLVSRDLLLLTILTFVTFQLFTAALGSSG